MNYKTEQEEFWAGDFGNEYVERNSDPISIAQRTTVFSRVLSRTKEVNSFLELGANIGQNLVSLKNLRPNCEFGAVEINKKASGILKEIPNTKVFEGSIFDFEPEALGTYDMTYISGVLIHINPNELEEVYRRLYDCSNKYILIKEYYNTTPVQVKYRGHDERLYKRDFAGEVLDKYSDLELVDYGFQYKRDPNVTMDDSTWFLLKKKNA